MEWLVDIFRQLGFPEPERSVEELSNLSLDDDQMAEIVERNQHPGPPMVFDITGLTEPNLIPRKEESSKT